MAGVLKFSFRKKLPWNPIIFGIIIAIGSAIASAFFSFLRDR